MSETVVLDPPFMSAAVFIVALQGVAFLSPALAAVGLAFFVAAVVVYLVRRGP